MKFLESLALRAAGRAEIIQPRPRSLFEPERNSGELASSIETETISQNRQTAVANGPSSEHGTVYSQDSGHLGEAGKAPDFESRPAAPPEKTARSNERAFHPTALPAAIDTAKSERQFSKAATVVNERIMKESAAPAPVREAAPDKKEPAHFTPIVRSAPVLPPANGLNTRQSQKPAPLIPRETAAPAIHVTIGRIEVRSVAAAQPPPRAPQAPRSSPAPSLEEWLGKRG